MFFSKRKYGKYKKLDLRLDYSEIRSFLDNICTCNLFRSDKNPLKDRRNYELYDYEELGRGEPEIIETGRMIPFSSFPCSIAAAKHLVTPIP